MYQITTTEKKLATIVEGIVYRGYLTSEKKERKELAKKIAAEALSKTFENEQKAEEFIYEKAFREPMHEEVGFIEDLISRLKVYILEGKQEVTLEDWDILGDIVFEEIECIQFDDEDDLQWQLELIVYCRFGYIYYLSGWRYEGWISF